MTLEEIVKLTYWWCQNLDQLQMKHDLRLAESTAFVGKFVKSLCLKTAKNLKEKARSYRSTRVNLVKANTIEIITCKVSGCLAELKRIVEVFSCRGQETG